MRRRVENGVMHARLALKTFMRTLLCYKKRVQVTYFRFGTIKYAQLLIDRNDGNLQTAASSFANFNKLLEIVGILIINKDQNKKFALV